MSFFVNALTSYSKEYIVPTLLQGMLQKEEETES
jgi:hypothetical protein